MASNFLDPSVKNSINQKFRQRRFAFFTSQLDKIRSDKPIKILDIGGLEIYWERMNFTEDGNISITLLNLDEFPTKHKIFTSVKGDACNLSVFKDKEFDIVFSNSVIEHLFTYEKQKKMADEVMRVGRYYYVQTPNYFFPIEPHWLFPFFQFLPISTRVFLTKNFSLGHHPKAATKEIAVERVNEVKLLTEKQMKRLFPDGKLYKEIFLGLIKSNTMYRFPED